MLNLYFPKNTDRKGKDSFKSFQYKFLDIVLKQENTSLQTRSLKRSILIGDVNYDQKANGLS